MPIYWRGRVCIVSSVAKRDFRVNPCPLSSNKCVPHLSTYINLGKVRKKLGPVCLILFRLILISSTPISSNLVLSSNVPQNKALVLLIKMSQVEVYPY